MTEKNQVLATGQRWIQKEDLGSSSDWVIVSLSPNGDVGLSGPGPCRSYRVEKDETLLRDWERVR